MAAIRCFGAVSMASDYKEEAYHFLMYFLNNVIQESTSTNGMSKRKWCPWNRLSGTSICHPYKTVLLRSVKTGFSYKSISVLRRSIFSDRSLTFYL